MGNAKSADAVAGDTELEESENTWIGGGKKAQGNESEGKGEGKESGDASNEKARTGYHGRCLGEKVCTGK